MHIHTHKKKKHQESTNLVINIEKTKYLFRTSKLKLMPSHHVTAFYIWYSDLFFYVESLDSGNGTL